MCQKHGRDRAKTTIDYKKVAVILYEEVRDAHIQNKQINSEIHIYKANKSIQSLPNTPWLQSPVYKPTTAAH